MTQKTTRRQTLAYATIFDIQRFSLHDGPGIRTTVFFKGCPIHCIWCQNPESHLPEPEMAFYSELCTESFNCLSVCPDNAVVKEGFRIDYLKCSVCGECADVCNYNALRVIGRKWQPEPLLTEVLKDRDFFIRSGGGLTLSGGEPMLYYRFLGDFLPMVKKQNIHIAMETCGVFKWDHMNHLLPFLDLIYFDIKQIDPKIHKRQTGAGNRQILENFTKLSASFQNLQARMPVIPGLNDEPEHIAKISRFLLENEHDTIHCLPYHNFGEAKLPRLNTHMKSLQIKSSTIHDLLPVKKEFEKQGITAVTYD